MKIEATDALDQTTSHLDKDDPIDGLLPRQRLEAVPAWGGASSSVGYVYRPTTVAQLRELFDLARQKACTIGFRGGGNSYGDAAMNGEGMVLDMRRMNRILAWDPVNGVIQVEPGVTIRQVWEYTLEDGWWPSVVPGTMTPTLGGCAGMNIHGKNTFKYGPIGNHIQSFDFMLPNGEVLTCSREENEDLFFAAIGSLGMLGCFTSITLQLKRIYSGYVKVEEIWSRNLAQMMNQFDTHCPTADYMVGWIDAFAKGEKLGRGQIHKANYLPAGADPNPRQSLRLDNQHLPPNIMGILPKSIMWRFMAPAMNNLGVGWVNWLKQLMTVKNDGNRYLQAHAGFNFLLDYVPDWKKAYGRHGLIQYQSFIPLDNALETYSEMLRVCQKHRLPNYLTVLKRHPADKFLMSHAVDGYSLAMDFRLTRRNRERVVRLTQALDDIVVAAGGRFYFAKDSTLRPHIAEAYLGSETITQFRQLKKRCDPENMLQTNLWRRVFGTM